MPEWLRWGINAHESWTFWTWNVLYAHEPANVNHMSQIKPPFGQHFLHDRNLLALIVNSADLDPDDTVLEVGVGTGKLTEAILESGASVIGVEIDHSLADGLEDQFPDEGSFSLIRGDILKVPWDDMLPSGRQTVLMGNLPYSVSTQVIFKAIENRSRIKRAVFLMQWEVGCRLTAHPGTREYGILAVACQLFGRPELVRKIPPDVFLPPPKVDSALIRWDLSPEPLFPLMDWDFTMKVIRASFGKRRKTLLNSLSSGIDGLKKEDLAAILKEMNILPTVRAEGLEVSQFADISDRVLQIVRGGR